MAFHGATSHPSALFKPARHLEPLGKDESRYIANIATDEDEEARPRASIINLVTRKTRLEIEEEYDDDGTLYEPSAFACLDRGPIGKPTQTFYKTGYI